MDMNTLDDQLSQLRSIPIPTRPAVERLAQRARRRRRRLRLTAITPALIVAAGLAYRSVNPDHPVRVAASGPSATITSPTQSDLVVVPHVLGETLSAASGAVHEAGLSMRVSDGDPLNARSVVVAADPGAKSRLAPGAVVGVRTALPDPPIEVECPASRHPRGQVEADALPHTEALTSAEAAIALTALRAQPPEGAASEIQLAMWDRSAISADGGVEDVVGVQIVVIAQDPGRCPSAPEFYNGVPVTYVIGPVAGWAGEPLTSLDPTAVPVVAGELADGRAFVLRSDTDHGLCLEIDRVNLGCDDVGPVIPVDADPTTARIAIDPSAPFGEVLAYGFLPHGAVDVVADLDTGQRVTGADISGGMWALALPEGWGVDPTSHLDVRYVLDDGTERPAPAP